MGLLVDTSPYRNVYPNKRARTQLWVRKMLVEPTKRFTYQSCQGSLQHSTATLHLLGGPWALISKATMVTSLF